MATTFTDTSRFDVMSSKRYASIPAGCLDNLSFFDICDEQYRLEHCDQDQYSSGIMDAILLATIKFSEAFDVPLLRTGNLVDNSLEEMDDMSRMRSLAVSWHANHCA